MEKLLIFWGYLQGASKCVSDLTTSHAESAAAHRCLFAKRHKRHWVVRTVVMEVYKVPVPLEAQRRDSRNHFRAKNMTDMSSQTEPEFKTTASLELIDAPPCDKSIDASRLTSNCAQALNSIPTVFDQLSDTEQGCFTSKLSTT